MIDLRKEIAPAGTWRYLGFRHGHLPLGQIPIAARTAKDIQTSTGGKCLRIGKISQTNAFVLDLGKGRRLLYARPQYSGYGSAARRVFVSPPPFNVDNDHALARKIAVNAGYNYVLLLRIPPRINRSHGPFEKMQVQVSVLHSIAFVDRRVLDKWLARHPTLFPGRRPELGSLPDESRFSGFTSHN